MPEPYRRTTKMSSSNMCLPDMSGFEEDDVTLSPLRDSEDEVFLIRVPKGYDVEKLNGIGEYSPPGIVQIEAKEGKRGLVSIVELGAFAGKDLDVNLLTNSGDNRVIAGPCIKQSLCVSRSVHLNPSTPAKTMDVGARGPVLMPTGLKPRFTPFGADCPVPSDRKKHKKQKKKKRERSEVRDTSSNDIYSSISGSDTSNTINPLYGGKRSSISKLDANDNIYVRLNEATHETSPSSDNRRSHKKKKKRELEPDDFLEYNSHANSSSSKSNFAEPSGIEAKSFINANNHKKKKKSEPVGDISDTSHSTLISSNSFEESVVNSSISSHHKKKKKRNSEADDHVFHDTSTNCLSLDVTEGTSSELNNTPVNGKEKKRGHKRKLSSGYQSLESSVVLDESLSLEPSSAERKLHKRKKRKKEHDA